MREGESDDDALSDTLIVRVGVSVADSVRDCDLPSESESVTLGVVVADEVIDGEGVSDLLDDVSLLALRVTLPSFESDAVAVPLAESLIDGESVTVSESVGVRVTDSE